VNERGSGAVRGAPVGVHGAKGGYSFMGWSSSSKSTVGIPSRDRLLNYFTYGLNYFLSAFPSSVRLMKFLYLDYCCVPL